jgi:hypothetical protein
MKKMPLDRHRQKLCKFVRHGKPKLEDNILRAMNLCVDSAGLAGNFPKFDFLNPSAGEQHLFID